MEFLDVLVWAGFLGFVLTLLALDLGVFHRESRAIRSGEALAWAGFYVSLALAFNVLVFFLYENNWLGVGVTVGHPMDGRTAALQFLTGYLLEQSLSLDNVFVIALIFSYFRIPLAYQHRVLFWGILGALVMRGIMIGLGAALIARFDWVVYVFGGILILTAARMLISGEEEPEPEKNWLIRLARRVYPVTPEMHGERFFVDFAGRRAATPLFLVLLMVESSDVLFAVDSIPAIFAVTQDPFLVFTSNVFAILGLRNLYFAIAPLLGKFKYLKTALVFILAFVGVKMLLSHTIPIPTLWSLSMIIGILAVGVLASAFAAGREVAPLASPLAADLETLTRVTIQTGKKIIVLVLGSTLLVIGALMVVLPGPALLMIPLGLAVLATEFLWARRLLRRLHEEVRSVANGRFGIAPPPRPEGAEQPPDPERERVETGEAERVNRVAAVTGLALVLLGLAIFGWKVWGYELPMLPTDPEGLWRVELAISARGVGARGSVRAPLPSTGPGQEVYDERSSADRLLFTIRTENGERMAIWRGALEGVHDIAYGFRVRLEPIETPLTSELLPVPPEIQERYGGASRTFPSDVPEIAATLASLGLPPPSDVLGRMRSIYALLAHEIATSEGGPDDALIALANHAGSERGKAALLVTLLRGAGIPARPVTGLELRSGASPRETQWVEAWAGGLWIPVSPKGAFFAERPASLVALRAGSLSSVETTGAEAVSVRWDALREHLSSEELAAMMVPPNRVLRAISLYRLPVQTQSALRLLMVLPLGALLVAIFRNGVGVPTFGTFMPVLIAFALRNVPIHVGLGMVVAVIGVGVFGRLVLERLRLLLVPRLAILLCLVVLGVAAFALLGSYFETRDLFSGVLFPIVILTMLIERFSIASEEEGLRTALVRAGWSLLVTAAVYPVLRDPNAEYLMFSFPELVLCVMGLLVWIGGYTGYRLSDLVRFRSFAAEPAAP